MCRGKGEGGRRCCQGHTQQAAHNNRRRKNRAIRRHVVEWAEQRGLDGTEIQRLKDASPKVVKDWAECQGLDPEKFADGIPSNPVDVAGDAAARAEVAAAPAKGHGSAWAAGPAGRPVAAPAAGKVAAGGGGGGGTHGQLQGGGSPSASHPGRDAREPAWSTQAWCTSGLQAQVQSVLDQQGGHRDERALLEGTPVKVRQLARSSSYGTAGSPGAPRGGTNTTQRVELDNGVTGYFKPCSGERRDLASGFGQDSHQQSIHEAAAWRLASQMGPPWSEIVPPVAMREVGGEMGSFALERPGRNMSMSPWHCPEWREAAFFDSLIGQQDRHPGNYLVAGDRLQLIDHGYTFACPDDARNYSWFVTKRVQECPALTYQEREVLQRVVSSPELLGLRSILQPERAEALKSRAEEMLARGEIHDRY